MMILIKNTFTIYVKNTVCSYYILFKKVYEENVIMKKNW